MVLVEDQDLAKLDQSQLRLSQPDDRMGEDRAGVQFIRLHFEIVPRRLAFETVRAGLQGSEARRGPEQRAEAAAAIGSAIFPERATTGMAQHLEMADVLGETVRLS